MAIVLGRTSPKITISAVMIGGGVDDAALADRRDEHAGGEGRGGDGDELSAEQHRADQAPAHRDEFVDEGRALVPAGLQGVQSRPRSGGERGLGAGEERRGDEAEDDQDGGHGHRHKTILAQAAGKAAAGEAIAAARRAEPSRFRRGARFRRAWPSDPWIGRPSPTRGGRRRRSPAAAGPSTPAPLPASGRRCRRERRGAAAVARP